jgi:hypothetical protein
MIIILNGLERCVAFAAHSPVIQADVENSVLGSAVGTFDKYAFRPQYGSAFAADRLIFQPFFGHSVFCTAA